MEEGECPMGAAAIDEETLNYDGDDVEMADADEEAPAAEVSADAGGGGGGGGGGAQADKGGQEGNNKRRKKRNKGKKKNRGRQDGPPTNIADINR
jgi:phosphorylated adapter RNA export protein